MTDKLYTVEQEVSATYIRDLHVKIALLEAVAAHLFFALDDEVTFCLDEGVECSEASLQALQKAEAANIGTSEALEQQRSLGERD